MKKIITNEELYQSMESAINLLCSTVKTTLGPIGNNAIINHSLISPFITNDGVTLAKNIESEDEVINTILELAKEASIKTDETVGDGTTTTLVFLESIFNDGLELIRKGKKPILLKKEIQESLENIINLIDKESIKPSKKDLLNIAVNSSKDEVIGKNVFDVYNKVKQRSAISLIESNNRETTIKFYKGYQFETNIATNYYFKLENNIDLIEPYILIVDNYLNDVEEIANILNQVVDSKKPLVILASDYSEDFVNNILSFYLNDDIKIYLLKNSEYGDNSLLLMKDLAVLGNCEIVKTLETISFKNLGKLEHIEIKNDKTYIYFDINEKIQKHIKHLKNELTKNKLNNDFIEKQLAMFQNGLAEIHIGGNTSVEIREKHMKYQDAVWSIDSANKGIVLGSGVVLLKIFNEICESSEGAKILKYALRKPFFQILENAGLDGKSIYEKIKNNNFEVVYNVNNNNFENKETTTIIDSFEVVKNSFINACSIASLLLTTSTLIINEYNDNIKKTSEYSEI